MPSANRDLRHCRRCNSQRPGSTCWKCGAITHAVAEGWDYPRLPSIEEFRVLAKEMGYTLAVHGSLERDLDLVAVPWTEDAADAEDLIEYLCRKMNATVAGGIEAKPHGRIALNLNLNGWYKLIDLSITPKPSPFQS